MTLFGWDASHFDGIPTKSQLALAKAQGISFVSHKLGEGLTNSDGTDATFLSNARDCGFELIGGYWFCHGTDSPVAEALAAIRHAQANESWWLTWPGAFWQVDAENSPTGLNRIPSPSWIKTFADTLTNETGLKVIVYASRGQYGSTLSGLGYPLWNASYGTNPVGPFKTIYQGDNFFGWLPYSGQVPTLLQYSSRATIAGLTTCDANAFRGTLDQLKTILMGEPVAITQDDAKLIAGEVWQQFFGNSGPQADIALQSLYQLFHNPVWPDANGGNTATFQAFMESVAQSANSGPSQPVTLDVTLSGTATPAATTQTPSA